MPKSPQKTAKQGKAVQVKQAYISPKEGRGRKKDRINSANRQKAPLEPQGNPETRINQEKKDAGSERD